MSFFISVLILSVMVLVSLAAEHPKTVAIGVLGNGARFIGLQSPDGWGLAVSGAGSASVRQPTPAQFEFYASAADIQQKNAGYETLTQSAGKATGVAHVSGPGGSLFTVVDHWTVQGNVIELARSVTVHGNNSAGFLSAITFSHPGAYPRTAVDYFAPGIIYGSPAHLSPDAISGPNTYGSAGHGQVRVREDRLPAPLFGIRFEDGSALTVLDPAPKGETTRADSHDTQVQTIVDERFQFGAIGADLDAGHQTQGFWFPGSEGEVTYRGNTYPGGQLRQWRRRYHPIRNGLVQQYRVQFRFSKEDSFPGYFKNAWRWAYRTLQPPVDFSDIAVIRRTITDVLASQVQMGANRAGIPNAVPAVANSVRKPDHHAIMGFTGKNLEAAEYLFADAEVDSDKTRAARDRKLGLAIYASFIKLRMNPPVGEGFNLDTGQIALAIPRDRCVFLRSFADDMKATLRAYHRERLHGSLHPEWLLWARSFGDWLLTQQHADGGFPRSWKPGTGAVVDPSPQSSYNPVPFLVLLAEETGRPQYLKAAERAADFVWSTGQSTGKFVGGTIDNPDVLDKEAGTLSTEAYLALYQATRNRKWLLRTCAAANYAETWIYLWNVPMPRDEDDRLLQWKRSVPTYGTQLIATGQHSLVDGYMSYDVDEYAKLGRWAADPHYLAVAHLLLYDTKNMLAAPGRAYDLKGPGWQQEHFSFAPVRGFGLHRLWLPWVACSQLNGIFELEEFDPSLFNRWTNKKDEKPH